MTLREQFEAAHRRLSAIPSAYRPTVTHPAPDLEPVTCADRLTPCTHDGPHVPIDKDGSRPDENVEESTDLTPGLVWDDRQLEVLRAQVARTYRAEIELEREKNRQATEDHWKDDTIRAMESRIRVLEDDVLRYRARIHTVVNDLQARYADDMRELAERRRMSVEARREIDKRKVAGKVPHWQHGSALFRSIVEELLVELEVARQSNRLTAKDD